MVVTTTITIITARIPSMMRSQRFSVRSTSSCGTIPLGRGASSGLEDSSANRTSRHEEEKKKEEPADEHQPHRHGSEQQRAACTVLERLRGGLRSDWGGHVLRQMSRGPMRRIDLRNRLVSLCHQRRFLLCRRGPKLLVVSSQRRDLLIVELVGEQAHYRMTGVAETELPHLQLEGDVVSILSAEVRDRRRLPSTVRSVAVQATGNPFRRVANVGELLTLGDESRAFRVRQRHERRLGGSKVGRYIRDIVFGQTLGKRPKGPVVPNPAGAV